MLAPLSSAFAQESADKAIVTTVGPTLTDASGNTFGISSGGLVVINGTNDATTSGVIELAYVNHVLWQENNLLNWYSYNGSPGAYAGPQSSPLSAAPKFTAANQQINNPSGNLWVGRGMNVYDYQIGRVDGSGRTTGTQIRTFFPGVNFIRLVCFDSSNVYKPASTYTAFINEMTAQNIVILLEHHSGAGGGSPVPTGANVAPELAWFKDISTTFKNNPYVWFGTLNEPSGGAGGDAAITANQLSVYNTVRATGNVAPVVLQWNSGGPGVFANYTASSYLGMHNVVWDTHFYSWLTGLSTDQTVKDNGLKGILADAAKFPGGDGKMGIIIGEFGPGTNGPGNDVGGDQVMITAERSETFGSSGGTTWHFQSDASVDTLLDYNENKTAQGIQITPWFAQPQPVTAEQLTLAHFSFVPPAAPFSVTGTIVGASVTPTLQYQNNGGAWTPLPAGSTVTSTTFSFSNPGLASNSAASISVRDANNTAVFDTNGFVVSVTNESLNNAIVTTVGPTLIDAKGAAFGISAGGQVVISGTADGTTSGVIELGYASHVVWQKNNLGNWYSYNGSPGSYTGPTTTSPVTASAEALTVDSISAQQANTTFTVSGTISGVSAAPVLQYKDNGGNWVALPGATGGTRKYYLQGGTNANVWNTPIGAGAIPGLATDLDTIDARKGGAVNPSANYGAVVWTSLSANDPSFRFTGTGANYNAPGGGTKFDITAHIPAGSYTPGPAGADGQMVFVDTTGHPGIYYHFAALNIPNLQSGQGPFAASFGGSEDATTDTYCEDWETQHANFIQACGVIRGADLDPNQNPARIPGTTLTAIQHVLRYAHVNTTNKNNAASGTNGPLNPSSWPQYYQDYQDPNGLIQNLYSGHMIYGTTLYIPMTTPQPANLSDPGKQLFWTWQHYGSIERDTSTGYTLYADQNVPASWTTQAQGDMSKLVPLLTPMRNQHQGGQSLLTNPKNGPGARLDSGPSPLIGTNGPGGNVTATTFSFTHPGMIAASSNTIFVRDANNPTVTATSVSFPVGTVVTESLALNTIPTQVAGTSFTVSGTISGTSSTPTLQYQDGTGVWTLLPSGATVSSTGFSFVHPAMTATSSAVVSVRDSINTGINAVSNTFTVNAGALESLTMAGIPTQQAGVPFTVSGTVVNEVVPQTLQYSDNGGPWAPLPVGFVSTSSAYSFTHPGVPASANYTVAVRDADGITNQAASQMFVVQLAESLNNSVVTTQGPVIVDATGEQFGISPASQVTVNGVVDPGTSNVFALAYVNHTVWQKNSGGLWFGKTVSTGPWLPAVGTITSPLPAESLVLNPIGGQTVGQAFSVTGTIATALVAPSLQYSISSGPWVSFPAGSTISNTAYSLTVPAVGSAGLATLAVRDAGTPSIISPALSFTVSAANAEILSVNQVSPQLTTTSFLVSGTIANASVAPTLQYAVSGGAWLSLPSGAQVLNTGFNFFVPPISTVGNATISIRDQASPSISAVSNSFAVTTPGVTPSETLTFGIVGRQLANTAFPVTGTIANATVIPTLQYAINGGTWLPIPAGNSVSLTTFGFTVPGQSAGTDTLSVRDQTTPTITAVSNSFVIAPPNSETLSVAPIAYQPVGLSFPVTGNIANLATAPTLQYSDNAGPFQPLPAGSLVSNTAWTFTHPGLPAMPSMTIIVRDVAHPEITAATSSFVVLAHESQNLTQVTAPGSQIVDTTGAIYTLTGGKQVAINGVPDPTTANVIELAYVNRQVWEETAALKWFVHSNTWGPAGGMSVGPLPSSRVIITNANTKKLAVVVGFTIPVPGLAVQDTVQAGNFQLVVNSVDGTVAMSGVGNGLTSFAYGAPLANINASLAGLTYTATTPGAGSINVSITDPAQVSASIRVPVQAVRAAGVIPQGR